MKFCICCKQIVYPTKKVNWILLMLLCLITSGGWVVIYIPYYFLFKGKKCPICNGNEFRD
ncbi:hypothetical protein SATMO3_35300 [Sporomusa aerivorans]